MRVAPRRHLEVRRAPLSEISRGACFGTSRGDGQLGAAARIIVERMLRRCQHFNATDQRLGRDLCARGGAKADAQPTYGYAGFGAQSGGPARGYGEWSA